MSRPKADDFPRPMRRRRVLRESIPMEFLNTGVSPFDSLLFLTNLPRAILRAYRTGDITQGKVLKQMEAELTYTSEQAQAAVDALPVSEQAELYSGQIGLMEERLETGKVPTTELKDYTTELAEYTTRRDTALGKLAAASAHDTPDAVITNLHDHAQTTPPPITLSAS